MMTSPLRVDVVGPVQATVVPWRHAGQRTLTVVVKATFALDEGAARLVGPDPIHAAELVGRSGGSPWHDSDLAPYKPRVDVTYVGHACAPQPVQQLRARLALQGERARLDKTIVVVGDQPARGAQPAHFKAMPIEWERSWADPHVHNPVGVAQESGRLPNLYDAVDGRRPAGFGPVARAWPLRRGQLARMDPRALDAAEPDLPGNMPWGFYSSAPPDQQLDALGGEELILLENLLDARPRAASKLPGAQARARLFGVDGSSMGASIDLRLDTLAIDGVRGLASLVWRGTIQRPDDASLSRASVAAGLELPGRPVAWLSSGPSAASRASQPHLSPPPPVASTHASPQPSRISVPSVESKTEAFVVPKGLPRLHDDDAVTYDLDDDPSSSVSTMAIDPDVAARMLAQRGVMPFGQGAPPPAPPPPAPPPPAPPPASVSRTNVIVRHDRASLHSIADDDSEEVVGATLAVSPEAAAELIARRRAELEAASGAPAPAAPAPPKESELARNGTVMIPMVGDRPPPPAPPPPEPRGPKRSGGGTLVMEPEDPRRKR